MGLVELRADEVADVVREHLVAVEGRALVCFAVAPRPLDWSWAEGPVEVLRFRDDAPGRAALRDLNAHRDVLLQHARLVVVEVPNVELLALAQSEATDLWSMVDLTLTIDRVDLPGVEPGVSRVFIGHAAVDTDRADQLAAALRTRGIRADVRHSVAEPGDVVGGVMTRSLRAADLVVLLLPQSLAESSWALRDLGAAFGLGKPTLAILTDDAAVNVPDGALMGRVPSVDWRSTGPQAPALAVPVYGWAGPDAAADVVATTLERSSPWPRVQGDRALGEVFAALLLLDAPSFEQVAFTVGAPIASIAIRPPGNAALRALELVVWAHQQGDGTWDRLVEAVRRVLPGSV